MSTRGGTEPAPTRVKRQRQSYSCTECTRRKLRCSKRIPCLACMERGIAHQCRRRSDNSRKETKENNPPSKTVHSPVRPRGPATDTTPGSPEFTPHRSIPFEHGPRVVDSVTQDAAVMLEFLALSRQHVLQATQVDRSPKNETLSSAYELLFTVAQVRKLMNYHRDCIAWTHNVVHMPTFFEQCEERLCTGGKSIEGGWLSLYYAILAV